MLLSLLGKKIGMSQYLREDGRVVPISVLQVGPCTVTQIKTQEKDGYEAAQLGFGEIKKINQPMRGHVKSTSPFRHLKEVPTDGLEGIEVGYKINVDYFTPGEFVTVVGTSKGKGFQGTVKRHGFAGGPRTHGQSDRRRAPGSIGAGTTPGRVIKGKKMSGHMGNRSVTVKNLEIIYVDQEKNLLFVKGGIPGAPQGLLVVHRPKKLDRSS